MTDLRNLGAVQIGTSDTPSGDGLLERIDRDLAHRLRHLLSVANDLHLAYGVAIKRLERPELREAMIRLDSSHEPLRTQLAELISNLGHSPSEHGDLHGLWDRARVVIGELSGEQGILGAMASSEGELASALREVRHMSGMPAKVHTLLDEALELEVGHREFYDRALGRFVG